jgi:putative peptidoglycan lipid II flippase
MTNRSEPPNPRPRAAHIGTVVALGTAASKIIGLLREIVIARAYGTGIVADAYYYAYMITGNLFVLLGGFNGPIDSCIITVLSDKDESMWLRILLKIARRVVSALTCLSLFICLIAPLVIPSLSALYQPKAAENQDLLRTQFAQEFLSQLYITTPLIILGGLLGVLYAIERKRNQVLLPSIAPAVASLVIISVVYPVHACGINLGWPLALATLAGALAQFLVQLPAWYKVPKKAVETDGADSAVAEFSRMSLPAFLSTSVGQLTVYVDSAFALGLGTGAWTALSYSSRLIQMPLGILNTALLIPMFPKFTESVTQSDIPGLVHDLHRCLRFLWFVTLPIVALFSALAQFTVSLLLEGDQFKSDSVRIVTLALLYLIPQMFFYLGRELLARIFWAFRDTKTPFRIALMVLTLKLGFDVLFVWILKMNVAGISLATTTVSAISFVVSIVILNSRFSIEAAKLVGPLTAMICAAVCSWIVTTRTMEAFYPVLGLGKPALLFSITASSAAGALTYIMFCFLFRIQEVKLLWELAKGLLRKLKINPKC